MVIRFRKWPSSLLEQQKIRVHPCSSVVSFLRIGAKYTAMRIDRVILATDGNPLYLEFWPLVARAWQRILPVRPTLALIGDETISVPEGFGDVVRFAPVSGVDTALQSQAIRLLLPT